jgi:hypothetical protein
MWADRADVIRLCQHLDKMFGIRSEATMNGGQILGECAAIALAAEAL